MRKRLSETQKKVMVILLGVTLLSQVFYVFPFLSSHPQQTLAQSGDEARAAAEISNLTGVRTEEILRIKHTDLSWNQVLEVLKNRHPNGIEAQKEQRSSLLAQAGTGDELIKQLMEQGYSHEEIMQAKLLAERVQSQLQELTDTDRKPLVERPSAELLPDRKGKDKAEAYRKLAEGFQTQAAIVFMLELKSAFGSMEAVLDEYLLSLQAELKLEDYLKDKDAYLKAKADKLAGITPDRIVTVSSLEQELLEIIKADNQGLKDDPMSGGSLSSVQNKETKVRDSPLPDVPVPSVKDVKPVNPADQIQKELNALNPNKPF
ncbi:hypothetical protein ACFQI7_32640 [Paenibacillus allorhizosphaerae]|uniref:Uncharacterized protein n=1 Tax=Paenibacillus allorhizosphaerae TaxID=2849866 RepID=A0ABM8VUC6_9BACL|nr:hypothetical protein [Paenibacillus allorhizosphaerae]CAG7658642.1 hypothetical protein PAECIP111802_07108 [Paenibacillus allorhizosphaerae]